MIDCFRGTKGEKVKKGTAKARKRTNHVRDGIGHGGIAVRHLVGIEQRPYQVKQVAEIRCFLVLQINSAGRVREEGGQKVFAGCVI
jgi:hypothetical protein